jgi:TRAP-type C4-dicarboxylate transport system permease small subunit
MTSGLHSLVAGITRVTRYVATSANIAGTLVVLVLVGVVNYDVIARGVFNQPFRGAVEVVQFSMVLIVFLQLPDVVRVNRLTQSDGFLLVIGKRFPRLTIAIRRAINLLSTVFMGIVAVAIFPEFIEMWHTKDYFGVLGVFTAPWWPIKLVIMLSTGLCAVLFLLKVLQPAKTGERVRLPESEGKTE